MLLIAQSYIVSLTIRLAQLVIADPHQVPSPIFANDDCFDGETVMIVMYGQFTCIVRASVIVIQ